MFIYYVKIPLVLVHPILPPVASRAMFLFYLPQSQSYNYASGKNF